MIETYFELNQLDSSKALFAATFIGFFFGLILERAGFGSSKKLAGIFYFKDMTVLKVMFSALVTAVLGLYILEGFGIIHPAKSFFHMKTFYYTHILAGIIFGIGFAMGGWCPGTAAVGLASGKIDAFLFIAGGIIGSIFYNELFIIVKPFATLGESIQNSFGQNGLAFIYKTLHMPREVFILILATIASGSFIIAEYAEKLHNPPDYLPNEEKRPNLLNPLFITIAILFLVAPSLQTSLSSNLTFSTETEILQSIDQGLDHVEPEALAELLMQNSSDISVVDIRSAEEYHQFHIKGAIHVPLSDLPNFIESHKEKSKVVLYSNGMVHPSEARDSLYRMGYQNVYILTDGLTGFINQCLKPVSLRGYPLSDQDVARISSFREFFGVNENNSTFSPNISPERVLEVPEI